MSDPRHYLIAKEGWLHISVVGFVAVVSIFLIGYWSVSLWILWLFVVQFFRDPIRITPEVEGSIIAPADGRILKVEKATNPQNSQDSIKVSIFMNVFNVHSNRSPIEGVVRRCTYFPGEFFNASLDKSSVKNERNMLLIESQSGQNITCVQIAGLLARRILCYAKEGDILKQGERYGFIRFGSRVDLYLPTSVVPKVAIGDKVSAGKTVLAFFNE